MTEARIMELMNQEIDGVNSAAESRELQDHLEGHPEDRRLYSELAEAVGIFAKVAPLDPPPGLQASILAATEPLADSRRRGGRTWLRDIVTPVLRPAVAASFALGLVAGILILEGYRNLEPGPDGDTMAHLRGMAGQDQDTLSLGPTLVRNLAGPKGSDDIPVAGEMRVTTDGPAALIELTITSKSPVTVRLVHPGSWSGTGFRTQSGQTGNLNVSARAMSFETDGAGRWEISLFRLDNLNDPMTLQVHHKGELVTEQTVTVQP